MLSLLFATSLLGANPPVGPQIDPEAAKKLYNQAVDRLGAGDAKGAIGLLEKCISKNPKNCYCYRALGVAHAHPTIEHASAAIGYLQAYLDLCPDAGDVEQFYAILETQPPRVPKGLGRCNETLRPARPMPRDVGESIRYHVAVNGVSMGTVDFKIMRDGKFEDQSVIEYRTVFKLDALVSSFVAIDGRAAALVPKGSYIPVKAMNRYTAKNREIEEDLRIEKEGRWWFSERKNNAKVANKHRRYPVPALDFLTGFYGLRALARDANGCAVFFSSGRAHTVWVQPAGEEKVKTPAGLASADKYKLRYGSELSRKVLEAEVWVGQDSARLPYRVKVYGDNTIDIEVHLYEKGTG